MVTLYRAIGVGLLLAGAGCLGRPDLPTPIQRPSDPSLPCYLPPPWPFPELLKPAADPAGCLPPALAAQGVSVRGTIAASQGRIVSIRCDGPEPDDIPENIPQVEDSVRDCILQQLSGWTFAPWPTCPQWEHDSEAFLRIGHTTELWGPTKRRSPLDRR